MTDFRNESKTIESATRLCSANHRLKQELKHVETVCACGASTRHASIQQEDTSHVATKRSSWRQGDLATSLDASFTLIPGASGITAANII